MSVALQNSHLGSGDKTIAQNIKNSCLESASEMNEEENIFHAKY